MNPALHTESQSRLIQSGADLVEPGAAESNKIGETETKMKKIAEVCAIALIAASASFAARNPMVGGNEMFPTKNIVRNALNSDDHTTLVAAVKATGLVDMLEGPGPFTVFAPTNEAFANLPAGTVDTLLMARIKPCWRRFKRITSCPENWIQRSLPMRLRPAWERRS
jgi:uncharacterized surface protein with fasciclin (FAS1) repeats